MLRYRQLEIRNAPKQPEGPAEERSGGTVRTLAREIRAWSLYTSRRKQIVHGRDFRINSVYKPGKRVSKRVDAGPTRPGEDRNSWLWTI